MVFGLFKRIIIIFVISVIALSFLFSAEIPGAVSSEKKEQYLKEKIALEITKEFDVLYPLDINIFTFKRGGEKLTFNDFLTISQDELLLKNQARIKKIRAAGFATAGVFGGCSVAFLIPSVIFVANMTNYNPIDDAYIFSGVASFILMGVSLVGLFIDLIVTFSLLYKYQFNEYMIKSAVERYNENLMKKLGITPDLTFKDDNISLSLRMKL